MACNFLQVEAKIESRVDNQRKTVEFFRDLQKKSAAQLERAENVLRDARNESSYLVELLTPLFALAQAIQNDEIRPDLHYILPLLPYAENYDCKPLDKIHKQIEEHKEEAQSLEDLSFLNLAQDWIASIRELFVVGNKDVSVSGGGPAQGYKGRETQYRFQKVHNAAPIGDFDIYRYFEVDDEMNPEKDEICGDDWLDEGYLSCRKCYNTFYITIKTE